MKLLALFGLGILFMLAGIEGNLGSMLGSIIDPANMVEGGSSTPTTPAQPNVNNLLGGVGPQYV